MSLLSLVITLIIVGILLWAVNAFVPMDAKIKQILNVVVIICVVIYLLYAFLGPGLGGIGDVKVPTVK